MTLKKGKQSLSLNDCLNDYRKYEKVDCFVDLIIVMLSNQSRNPVLLAFCTSLRKTSPQLIGVPTSGID